ncbi:MAG: hypothetical protein WDN48_13575 [Pseudolabrys sp.]
MKNTTYYNASRSARRPAIYHGARSVGSRPRHPRPLPELLHLLLDADVRLPRQVDAQHNHLLGAVTGVDGIKTGYIHDSGFNIVTSVRRAGRDIVAVEFGGRTANARDARVRGLIESNIMTAAVKRTAPPMVEGWETAEAAAKPKVAPDKELPAPAAPVRVAAPAAPAPEPEAPVAEAPTPGSTDPIKPNAVKTFTVRAANIQIASLSPLPSDSRKLMPAPATANAASVTTVSTVKNDSPSLPPPPGAKPGVLGVL